MKKIFILFMLLGTLSFALEIKKIDPLDFGVVVTGDKTTSLENVGVYVEGSSGKKLEIVVPEAYELGGNKMIITPKEKIITLDDDGKGVFRLDIKLVLKNTKEYKTLTDQLNIKVKYVD